MFRSGLALLVALSVAGVGVMAGPERVWAADPFVHEVVFPGAAAGPENMLLDGDCSPVSGAGTYAGEGCDKAVDGNEATQMSTTSYPPSTTSLTVFPGDPDLVPSVFRILQGGSGFSTSVIEVWTTDGGGSPTGGQPCYEVTVPQGGDSGPLELADWGYPGSFCAAAPGWRFKPKDGVSQGGSGWTPLEVEMYPISEETAGCIGVGGLAWGADGLTTTHPWYGEGSHYGDPPAGWGDVWSPGIGEESACLVSGDPGPVFNYQFQAGELGAVGETYQIHVAFYCFGSESVCGVGVGWIDGNGVAVGGFEGQWIVDFVGPGSEVGGSGYARGGYGRTNLPPGATGVRFYVDSGTFVVALGVGYVEGTEADGEPGFDAGPGGAPGPGHYFESCEQPDGGSFVDSLLNIGGWVAWVGCMVGESGRWITDAIGSLAWNIAGAITGAIVALFVPTQIDDSAAELGELLDTRAPFAWIGQLSGFFADGLTGANLAGSAIAGSMTIMGASVTVDPAAVFGELGWLRPVLAGLIYLGCAVAIWRKVGGALGMGQSE